MKFKIRTSTKWILFRWLKQHGKFPALSNLPSDKEFMEKLQEFSGIHFKSRLMLQDYVNNIAKQNKQIKFNGNVRINRRNIPDKYAENTPKPVIDPAYSRENYLELLASDSWRQIRYIALRNSNGKCQLCGMSRMNGIVLHVDHVIPASVDWSRRLDYKNLQVLCKDCNLGKSNTYQDDWR